MEKQRTVRKVFFVLSTPIRVAHRPAIAVISGADDLAFGSCKVLIIAIGDAEYRVSGSRMAARDFGDVSAKHSIFHFFVLFGLITLLARSTTECFTNLAWAFSPGWNFRKTRFSASTRPAGTLCRRVGAFT